MASNRRPSTITVVHDPDPPELTTGAATVLLRILRKEHERRTETVLDEAA